MHPATFSHLLSLLSLTYALPNPNLNPTRISSYPTHTISDPTLNWPDDNPNYAESQIGEAIHSTATESNPNANDKDVPTTFVTVTSTTTFVFSNHTSSRTSPAHIFPTPDFPGHHIRGDVDSYIETVSRCTSIPVISFDWIDSTHESFWTTDTSFPAAYWDSAEWEKRGVRTPYPAAPARTTPGETLFPLNPTSL
ncbi:MAG: hypothetical protein Q9195_007629 [Heterodermia aff. obscurata]